MQVRYSFMIMGYCSIPTLNGKSRQPFVLIFPTLFFLTSNEQSISGSEIRLGIGNPESSNYVWFDLKQFLHSPMAQGMSLLSHWSLLADIWIFLNRPIHAGITMFPKTKCY